MSRTKTIAALGEFAYLRGLLPRLAGGRGVIVGPGDDCAVVRCGRSRLLLTTDAVVDGVHFWRAWMSPRAIGRKAFLVNASDIAAMGGVPRYCVVSIGIPPDFPVSDLDAVHRGIADAARATGAAVVGGNLSRARQLFVSIALIGEAPPRPLLRSGARAGDALFVSGLLGEAALGLRDLTAQRSAAGAAVRRFREPAPRLALGAALARHRVASAAIDVSDGLLRDLGHLCAASGVGAEVDAAAVPCSARAQREPELALTGGEDYELLFAVPPSRLRKVAALARVAHCRLTRIGRIVPKRYGIRVLDQRGKPMRIERGGFDHFQG